METTKSTDIKLTIIPMGTGILIEKWVRYKHRGKPRYFYDGEDFLYYN